MDVPRLAISATGPAVAVTTNPPHPIHHRPSGYQIDSNKMEKISKAFTRGVNFFIHAVQYKVICPAWQTTILIKTI